MGRLNSEADSERMGERPEGREKDVSRERRVWGKWLLAPAAALALVGSCTVENYMPLPPGLQGGDGGQSSDGGPITDGGNDGGTVIDGGGDGGACVAPVPVCYAQTVSGLLHPGDPLIAGDFTYRLVGTDEYMGEQRAIVSLFDVCDAPKLADEPINEGTTKVIAIVGVEGSMRVSAADVTIGNPSARITVESVCPPGPITDGGVEDAGPDADVDDGGAGGDGGAGDGGSDAEPIVDGGELDGGTDADGGTLDGGPDEDGGTCVAPEPICMEQTEQALLNVDQEFVIGDYTIRFEGSEEHLGVDYAVFGVLDSCGVYLKKDKVAEGQTKEFWLGGVDIGFEVSASEISVTDPQRARLTVTMSCGEETDGGVSDGGTETDGGSEADAGPGPDGGTLDGGPIEDGGASDGGTVTDGGAVVDGGTSDGGVVQECAEATTGVFSGLIYAGTPLSVGGYVFDYLGINASGDALMSISCGGLAVETAHAFPEDVVTVLVDSDNGKRIAITPHTNREARADISIAISNL